MVKIKVILVDDHSIVRDGIRSILLSEDGIDVIGEVASFAGLKEVLDRTSPDIVVMDISLPDMSGIEIVKILTRDYPGTRAMMLTMHTDEDFIFNSVKAGAKGYLPKNTTKKELIRAIRQIYAGEEYFSDEIKNIIMKSYVKQAVGDDGPERYSKLLTRREEEILKLCAKGMGNKDIADKLFISARTVESHKNHIMNKLELKSNVDLVKFAIKNKLIELD
ncbi:MAG: response regulator [Chloroflexota bacterium]